MQRLLPFQIQMKSLQRSTTLPLLLRKRWGELRFVPGVDARVFARSEPQRISSAAANGSQENVRQGFVNDITTDDAQRWSFLSKLRFLAAGGLELQGVRFSSTWSAVEYVEGSTQTWLREYRLGLKESQRIEEDRVENGVHHSNARVQKSHHQTDHHRGQWAKIYGHGRDEKVARVCRLLTGKKWWGPDLISTLDRMELSLEPYIVNQILKQQQRVQVAVGFFQWAKEQKGYKHNTCVYNTMIGIVGSNKDFVAMKGLMEEMLRDGCEPNAVTFTVIIRSFGAKKIDKAVDTFEHMKEFGFPPDVATYNCLIDLLIKAGDDQKAWSYFEKLKESGLEPDRITHNILYSSFVKCGRVDDACTLTKSHLPVSKYNSLIHFLGRGNNLEDALKVFHNMQVRGKPDNFTYSSLITFFGKAGKVDAAWEFFQEMKRSGCKPDVVVYSAIMSAFRKAGKADQVLGLFSEMKRQGCEPDRESYSDLIHSLVEASRPELACKFLEEMKERGFEPKITTYSDVLWMLGKAGIIEEAVRIFQEMKGLWRKPRVNSYHSMIVAFSLAGRMADAMDIFKESQEVGCIPVSDMYSDLIHGFCKVGDIGSARELFLEMNAKGFFLDLLTYNVLINSLCKAKRVDEALQLLKKMPENGCIPNVVSYTTLIRGFGDTGRDDLAFSLFKEMKEKGCTPNVITFNTLINMLTKKGKSHEAYKLIQEMEQSGCPLNDCTMLNVERLVSNEDQG